MPDIDSDLPRLIQGGMGAAISTWRLARAVAARGHLGVVSGTALERAFACRLQEGDAMDIMRSACDAFPDRALADRVYARWHRPAGLSAPGAYAPLPMFGAAPSIELLELTVVAAFVEVCLAKRGHDGPVGINLLTKIEPPILPTLYGAMLAGVDVVLMGAGIPREVPAQLERLAAHQPAVQPLHLADGTTHPMPFDPAAVLQTPHPPLRRPRFLAIISSHVLATAMARGGGCDGFVVEGAIAGGHNAPPRGWSAASGDEPSYGPRDVADLERIRALGLPFWLAGGRAEPGAIAAAQAQGAAGIQVGTPFAFCAESGMEPALRRRALRQILAGEVAVVTDGRASPTGFPFKLLPVNGSEGARDPALRQRQPCVLGYLRTPFRRDDGGIGWRCPSEPERDYVAKGGQADEADGRRCLCNGLMATAGHAHVMRDGEVELPLVTAGDRLDLAAFAGGEDDYAAADVLRVIGG